MKNALPPKPTEFHVIDGKLYDPEGYHVDSSGRRFLQRLPEVERKIKEMREQAIARAKSRPLVFSNRESKEDHLHLQRIKDRLDSLREDIHHLSCHRKFLELVADLRSFERMIDEQNRQIESIKRYRDHLTQMRLDRDRLLSENAETRKSKDREILDILDEIESIESRIKPRAGNRAGNREDSHSQPKLRGLTIEQTQLIMNATGKTLEELKQLQ